MFADYHVHSHFSEDTDFPMELEIQKAIKLGMDELCFTEHSDYDVPTVVNCDYDAYFEEMEKMKDKYKGQITLKTGIEFGIQTHTTKAYEETFRQYPFVFVEEEVDKRSKLFKAASRAGSAVEFETPKEDMLIRWILGRIQREGKKITQSVMQLFLSKTGSDMENIDKELEKLICYTLDKTEISAADVEAICTGQTENKIFEMIDAISAKNQKKALDLYYDLLALKEAPMRILFLIARQFQNLLLIKSMSAKGYPAVSIAKTAGMPSFAVQKNLRQAGAFKINQLKEAIEDCGQAEEDVKTGRMADQLAVELLIVKYSA